MEPSEETLASRARRSYERGRLHLALRRSAPLLLLLAVALFFGHQLLLTVGVGLLLLATSVGLFWRGEVYGGAVLPGVACGAVPFALSILASTTGHVCSPLLCLQISLASCIGGGLLAGFLVGRSSARLQGRNRIAFLVSAGSVAALVATPACAIAGVAGVVGMLCGVVVGTAPGILLATSTT
jgi:hypothetical protein